MDEKFEIIRDVETKLSDTFDLEDIRIITGTLTLALKDYDINKKTTELVVYDDSDDRAIRRYTACLKLEGKSEKTIHQYLLCIKNFRAAINKSLKDVGPYDIRYYLACCKDRQISNVTVNNYKRYLSAFYEWAKNDMLITVNPVDSVSSIKIMKEVKLSFNETEIDKMRSACKTTRERMMIEFFLTSGVRVDEFQKMLIEDIDLQSMSVHVKHGKGGKERITYLDDVAIMYFKKYLQEQNRDTGPVVMGYQNKALSLSQIRSILKSIGERAGVADVHPHRFRRTFATRLVKRGMPIQDIQRLMGHSEITTTMLYVSLDNQLINDSYKKYAT